jgi:hypothetical protein
MFTICCRVQKIVPVLAFYQLAGVPIATVNGDQAPDLVFKEIAKALGEPVVPITDEAVRAVAAKYKAGAN